MKKRKIIIPGIVIFILFGGLHGLNDRWKDFTIPGCSEARKSAELEIERIDFIYPRLSVVKGKSQSDASDLIPELRNRPETKEYYEKLIKEQELNIENACR